MIFQKRNRLVKLTALTSKRVVSLIGLLDIRAVNLTDLEHVRLGSCPGTYLQRECLEECPARPAPLVGCVDLDKVLRPRAQTAYVESWLVRGDVQDHRARGSVEDLVRERREKEIIMNILFRPQKNIFSISGYNSLDIMSFLSSNEIVHISSRDS